MFEFKLPDIGEGVHEGEIAKWLVKQGDTIQPDQPMVEVMTDKVTVEITSPVGGTVESLRYQEGDTVKVGSIVITINESGATSGAAQKSTQAETAAVSSQASAASSAAQSVPKPEPVAVGVGSNGNGSATASVASHKVLAAPAVRKMARTQGIDLSSVTGSGPMGRVQKQDLLAYTTSPGTKPLTVAPQSLKPLQSNGQATRIPYRGMRRKIGDHLAHSKQTVPHFTYVEEADMTDIVKMRADLLPETEAMGVKLSYLPFIIKAVIAGLKKYPKLNSSLDEAAQEIILKPDYNIGIAVAADDGLIVPVIPYADQKSILQLAQEITELSQKARNNKLALTDMQGGTFTLTSIGSIGGIFSAPIINTPEVGIMGINKIEKRPVVRNDQIVIREMTYLSLSGDHRVVDGAEAALFMREVISWLEHPGKLLLS